ncbi:DUF692 domain-containing protein [Ningiella sp. W23]|uniref:DUF692 domain-containing protein n=1 Tax=Ningiella sp. W23 TaxID=3023715 RepID=UPI003756D62E
MQSSSAETQILKPGPLVGVGLRHLHYDDALAHDHSTHPIDFVEIHAENFYAKGGITRELLYDVREKYDVSVHGTSLGLGSQLRLPKDQLTLFSDLVERTDPLMVSEHLCFNRANIDGQIYHSGDLLPIAYNQLSLNAISDNIQQLQDAIKRPILIENLSAYIKPSDMEAQALDEMRETEFLIAMCKHAGCGLLLDLNNLIVNALNQGTQNVLEHVAALIDEIPPELVGEIHLAGFSEQQVAGFIIDDHGQAVSEQCWQIYKHAVKRFSSTPTLVEWDTNLPTWEVLVQQGAKARQLLAQAKRPS